ncbi:hypothetical protein E2C01_012822 [Portunus trituberculatus]|uniref:Uncharacterized protein n=1 Tax=Portunus trituberculatus TaxID=210409 RepID=A0A5B7DEP6_PORTR|nr:hypothetical protein [Portunus trituberculatus]
MRLLVPHLASMAGREVPRAGKLFNGSFFYYFTSINRPRVLTPRQCLLAALVPRGASPQCFGGHRSGTHCLSQTLSSYFPLLPAIVSMSLGGNIGAMAVPDARRYYWNGSRPSLGSCFVFTDPAAQLEHGPEGAASMVWSVYL